MPFRASDIRVLDYGNAVQAGQRIKYNRLRNQALTQDQQERDDQIRRREQMRKIRQQTESMPAAIEDLEAQGLFREADALRDSYLQQQLSGLKVARTLAAGLNADNYDQVRADLIQSGAISGDMWPTEYSADWWANKVAKQKGELETITRRWQDENGYTVSQDLLVQDGSVMWTGTAFEDAADRRARTAAEQADREAARGPGGDFKFKASDSNAIGRQAVQLYGGYFDPVTQKFSGLDPDKAAKVQAAHARAEEIYIENRGRIGHGQAMALAGRELGIPIKNPADRSTYDPAGILPEGGQFAPPASR